MGGYRKKPSTVENFFLLHKLHKLIQAERTGNVMSICRKFNITHSSVMRRLDQLREMGADIAYNKKSQTYFYLNNFEFEITVRS